MADAAAVSEYEASLHYHHTLGLRVPPGNAIQHLSDDTVVYLSGKHVAAFQYENATHRFILKGPKTSEISCFCVSSNRKYIALAEKTSDGLQVNIYTQSSGSKVRCLEFKYLSKLPVVSMDFSTDNKFLATVTALPDVYIYLWQVDKSRLVGMIDVPYELTKITVSPWAHWSMCTTGPASLRLWRLADKQLKQLDPLPKRKDGSAAQSYRFTTHAWYDEEKLVAGTEEGDILVIESPEVKKVLKSVHGEGCCVTSLVAISRGFLCGGEGGIISIFERTFDDINYFRSLKRFVPAVPINRHRVLDMSVSPKGESAIVLYNNNSVSAISLENVEVVRENDPAFFHPLSIGFHSDLISAADVCVQKPIFMTGSADKTVRVWNFMRRRVEFTKTFEEEVLSLALHPTGLRAVIGFKSYMRMFNVLATDLHYCSEFPVKPCYEVKFSNGGQHFAAVVAHRVLVFNSYDFQCVAQLSGHSVMIRSICFSRNDQLLTSADLNGIIYTWQIDSQKRIDTDETRKNVSYNCVQWDESDNGTAAALGVCRVAEGGMGEGEITLRTVAAGKNSKITRPGIITTKLPAHRKQHTSEIALSAQSHTLFAGMPNGTLLLYRYPLTDDAQPYQKFEIHEGEISFVILTKDERFLFTLGEDNAMYMFEVDALCDGRSITKKPFNFAAFDDVCYVLQSEIDERTKELSVLQQELDEVRQAKQRDEITLQQRYEQERNALEREKTAQIESLKRHLDAVTTQKSDAEKVFTENSKQLESVHLKAAEELETLYSKRTEEATLKYNQLKTERDDLIVRYENKLFKLQKDQDAERRKLEEKCRETEGKLEAEISDLRVKMSEEAQVQRSMLDQTILDYETQVDELNAKYKQVITKKEEDLSRAINNSSTGERDTERLRGEKIKLNALIKDKDFQIQELEGQLDKRKKDNDSLRKEMLVRFESISTAEKKIQQLKKQTTELEKLRYVLTFKFNELKKEVAPKDKQIEFMTQRVEEMDQELERVALDREQLKQQMEKKEEKLAAIQHDITNQRKSLNDKEREMNTMLRELSELTNSGDTKKLVYQLKEVILRHATRHPQEVMESGSVEDERTAEFQRQREYMEAQLTCIKRQNQQKEQNLKLEAQRGTAENAILVKEINELRHEKKLLVSKCQMIEAQLKEARIALQRATTAGTVLSEEHPTDSTGGPQDTSSAQLPPVAIGTPPASRNGGRIIRGPTRAIREIAQLDSDKIARIIAQVERNNAEMERQQDEIVRLRGFVAQLLARAEADVAHRTPLEAQRHEEIKKHLAQASAASTLPAAS